MNKKILAKSSGLTLDTHSKIISVVSMILLNKIVMVGDVLVRFKNIIELSALLHDIGKCTIVFQKFLYDTSKTTKNKFRHNEIGWAFLSKYLSNNIEDRNLILNIVYWHHGISNQMNKYTDTEILNTLDEKSISQMTEYLISVVGKENVNVDVENLDSDISPLYYPTNDFTILQLCRSIVVTSDRIASHLNDISEIKPDLIDNYLNQRNTIELQNTKFDGTSRFENQKNIVETTNKTTILKAPAGFGKTIIGILWGLKFKQKVIWVVPRNIIAESLYLSITEDCKSLNIQPTIQLILSNEIKRSNNNLGMFEADITITNIDNFLAPSFKNDMLDSSALLLGANIIFDEYHELVSDAPFMSLFINTMCVRHKLTNSNTLLLSATPIEIEHLWDSLSNKTRILPNKESHYAAVHNKKYKLNVLDKTPNITRNTNSIFIKNTIIAAQNEKTNNNYSLLLHSDFVEDTKSENFNTLITDYGKQSNINNIKANVIGTHIIQASLDISFNHLFEDILSPQSTIQRIGRCDRFGTSIGSSSINIIKDNNTSTFRSENMIKDILYSRNLSDTWFDYIKKYDDIMITLDELYVIYNDFNKIHTKTIKNFVRQKFDKSNKYISRIYPIKFDNKPLKNNGILTAGSNKLRSVNTEIFYIVKHETRDEWIGLFTKELLGDIDKMFNEEPNTLRRMLKTMKKLRDANDIRFEYNDIIDNKKITIDNIRRLAKKSNTPYIVYDRVYNDELGIVKNK